MYENFLVNISYTAEAVLSILTGPVRYFESRRKIARIHISICNSITNASGYIFSTKGLVRLRHRISLRSEPSARAGERVEFCSADAKVGDIVILISGLSVPMIVRRLAEPHRLQLISPSTVVDVMQGAAWRTTEEFQLKGFIIS